MDSAMGAQRLTASEG